jgi:Domain of unknown function (DUF5668)
MSRTRGLLLPLALIAIGIIVLLANTGVLSQQALERLGDLWPLLLVILGLQLILNHTLPRRQATLIGLGATVLLVVAALLYATLAPAAPFGTRQADFSEQVGGLTSATLDLNYSGASADIQAGSIGDALYRAHVDYPGTENPPSISLDHESGTLAIRDENSGIQLHLFGSSRRHVLVTLSDHLPWTIQIGGGAVSLRLDLRHLQLAKLQVSGGASRVDAQLPSPRGTVLIDVSGGVTNLTLRAPAHTEWHIAGSGGVSAVTVNGASFGGFGDFQRDSPGYASASSRFDIEISGGASHVDFRTG